MGQFGDKFRKAREKKGISLDDVSNVTKISSRMLQAIEDERFEQLPGGVFNKGFIRAYARHVGLNDEEAINEYLACLRQAQIDAQAVWEPNASSAADKRPQVAAHQIAANQAVAGRVTPLDEKSKTRPAGVQVDELPDLHLPRIHDVRPRREFLHTHNALPWRPVVIGVLLLIAVGVVWQRHMRHARAQESSRVPASPMEQPAPQPAQSTVPSTAANRVPPAAARASSQTQPAKATGSGAANATHSAVSTGTKPSTPVSNPDQDDSTPPDTANAVPVAKTPARFSLVIHAEENSWISVTADGQSVNQETLIAPADASIYANREIVARIGNAAGVSFVWNGQQIQPQGAEAEVKTFVFDENGMHEVAGQGSSQTR